MQCNVQCPVAPSSRKIYVLAFPTHGLKEQGNKVSFFPEEAKEENNFNQTVHKRFPEQNNWLALVIVYA